MEDITIMFGLFVSIALPMLNISIAGLSIDTIKYPILVVVVVIIMWQLDEMIRLTIRHKRKVS